MKYKIIKSSLSVQKSLELLEYYLLLFIVDDKDRLVGSLSNGDVRRSIKKNIKINESVSSIMNTHVHFAYESDSITEKKSKISSLPEEFAFLPIINKNLKIIKIVSKNQIFSYPNKVVLMAGGLGSRLGELTKTTPKPLLKIGEKPILEIIIDRFKSFGFRNFIISVNYKAEMIIDYFKNGDKLDINIKYLHETKRMGTAGCLSLIKKEDIKESFFVMNGDILTEENFNELLLYHQQNNFVATMCVIEHKVQIPYGVIEADEKNNITALVEKPTKTYNVNAGIYVLEPCVLSYIPKNTFFDMPTLFQKLKDDNQSIGIYKMKTSWIDIGHPEDYYRANSNE